MVVHHAQPAPDGKVVIYIDEIYLLFQHEYSANFLFTLWKRMRKYGACGTGLTQNVDDLLQSHTARTMLANSEFLLMLNQASTDRIELARLLNISDNQLSYISGVDFGHGLLKCGSTIVPFVDHFPKNGKLYQLMTTNYLNGWSRRRNAGGQGKITAERASWRNAQIRAANSIPPRHGCFLSAASAGAARRGAGR